MFLSFIRINNVTHANMRVICSISSTRLTDTNLFSPHKTPRKAEYKPEKINEGSIIRTSSIDCSSANSVAIRFLNRITARQTQSDTASSINIAAEHTALETALSVAVDFETMRGMPDVISVSSTKKNDNATE